MRKVRSRRWDSASRSVISEAVGEVADLVVGAGVRQLRVVASGGDLVGRARQSPQRAVTLRER